MRHRESASLIALFLGFVRLNFTGADIMARRRSMSKQGGLSGTLSDELSSSGNTKFMRTLAPIIIQLVAHISGSGSIEMSAASLPGETNDFYDMTRLPSGVGIG